MDRLAMMLYVKMLLVKQAFFAEERGAVEIVAIVVMIGIAVALALFFKEQIAGIMTTLFGNISDAAANATGSI